MEDKMVLCQMTWFLWRGEVTASMKSSLTLWQGLILASSALIPHTSWAPLPPSVTPLSTSRRVPPFVSAVTCCWLRGWQVWQRTRTRGVHGAWCHDRRGGPLWLPTVYMPHSSRHFLKIMQWSRALQTWISMKQLTSCAQLNHVTDCEWFSFCCVCNSIYECLCEALCVCVCSREWMRGGDKLCSHLFEFCSVSSWQGTHADFLHNCRNLPPPEAVLGNQIVKCQVCLMSSVVQFWN